MTWMDQYLEKQKRQEERLSHRKEIWERAANIYEAESTKRWHWVESVVLAAIVLFFLAKGLSQ